MVSLQLSPRSICLSLLGISLSRKQVQQIHAQVIANSMLTPSPFPVTKLIEHYVSAGRPEDSIQLFAGAASRAKYTYIHAFRAFARLGALRGGKQAHAQVVKSGLGSDIAIQTTAIDFYANCKDIKSAHKMFSEMPERNIVTWTAMLDCYCANGAARQAFVLLHEMLQQCVRPTERTAVVLLSACSQLRHLNLACATHAFVYKFSPASQDVFIGTELVDVYSKCGSLENALRVFDEMNERNVRTWTAMASGLAMHGNGKEALRMMDEMQRNGTSPNELTFTCVLSACCHGGLLEEGIQIFDAIKKRCGLEPVIQHYGCVVDLLGRAGMVEEAKEVVRRMPMEPDLVVWRALLSACQVHGRVEIGEEVGRMLLASQNKARKEGTNEDFLALSNVYASAGRWEDVVTVRKGMRRTGVKKRPGLSAVQIL